MRGISRAAAFSLIAALSLTACGGGSDDNPLAGSSADSDGKSIVVGSANFPENQGSPRSTPRPWRPRG